MGCAGCSMALPVSRILVDSLFVCRDRCDGPDRGVARGGHGVGAVPGAGVDPDQRHVPHSHRPAGHAAAARWGDAPMAMEPGQRGDRRDGEREGSGVRRRLDQRDPLLLPLGIVWFAWRRSPTPSSRVPIGCAARGRRHGRKPGRSSMPGSSCSRGGSPRSGCFTRLHWRFSWRMPSWLSLRIVPVCTSGSPRWW